MSENLLRGRGEHLLALRRLSAHLDRLEQLRVGSQPDRVHVSSTVEGRTHVWYAPAGVFEPQRAGGWVYRDELGKLWDHAEHDRAMRNLGRLPYGHRVLTPDEAAKLTRINYLRRPLERPHLDDRRRHR